MRNSFKWLERLSLDAVFVAMAWGVALSHMMNRHGIGHDMVVLAIATWLTYAGDRLWEVRPGRIPPETERHAYYKNHYREFFALWVLAFAVVCIVAITGLPAWKVAWGWLIVFMIISYLLLVDRIAGFSQKLLLKRTVVPVIFTTGVVWMTESWRSVQGIAGSAVLLFAAFANVLLISYWESHDRNRPKWLEGYAAASLLFMLVFSNAALYLDLSLGLAGLLCAGGYFYLFIRIKTGVATHVRAWVDAILVGAALVVLL